MMNGDPSFSAWLGSESDGAVDKVAVLADLIKKGAYTPWIIIVPACQASAYHRERSRALGIPDEWAIISGYLSASAMRKLGYPIKAIDVTGTGTRRWYEFK